jgi:very-short-patch-repair endonuclease
MRVRDVGFSNFDAARRLRRESTQTETLLWEQLRHRRLEGLKFRRQHPVGRFVLDFYCAEARLAVEIDGPIHSVPMRQAADLERQNLLEERGITFLRIPAYAVETRLDEVLELIVAACRS